MVLDLLPTITVPAITSQEVMLRFLFVSIALLPAALFDLYLRRVELYITITALFSMYTILTLPPSAPLIVPVVLAALPYPFIYLIATKRLTTPDIPILRTHKVVDGIAILALVIPVLMGALYVNIPLLILGVLLIPSIAIHIIHHTTIPLLTVIFLSTSLSALMVGTGLI